MFRGRGPRERRRRRRPWPWPGLPCGACAVDCPSGVGPPMGWGGRGPRGRRRRGLIGIPSGAPSRGPALTDPHARKRGQPKGACIARGGSSGDLTERARFEASDRIRRRAFDATNRRVDAFGRGASRHLLTADGDTNGGVTRVSQAVSRPREEGRALDARPGSRLLTGKGVRGHYPRFAPRCPVPPVNARRATPPRRLPRVDSSTAPSRTGDRPAD